MRHAGFALVAALAAAAPSPKPPAPRPLAPPRVGFIWHFPFVDVGTAQVAGSGATSMIARVPWVVAQPGPDRWDMGSLDRQISEAERGGFSLVLLLECNPFCAPKWLRDQVAAAGESVRDASGVAGDVPSSASEVFARAQRRFVETVIAAVRTRDRHPVITHYQVGVEWWFPYEQRHAPAHIAAFRAWLARRYRTVSGVNRAWGSAFASFAEVTAPRTHVTGRMWEKGRSGLIPVLSQDAPDAPTGGPGASHDWAMFWHETAAGYINSLAAMARRLDPSRPTMSFLTMSFAQGAEWDYVDWSAIRLDEVCARARDITEIGMQLPAARGDAFRIAVGLDIARKYRKPMSVLDLLDFTDGVKAGRAVHDRATHTAIQHGASSLYYCCWNGAKDFSFHPDWPEDELRAMLTDARRTLDLVEGMTVVADGAIVLPIMPGVPGTEDARSRSATSFMGWYKLLERLHRTVDVITLWEIERGLDLSRYRWVVLPDCEIALKGAASRLNGFARSRRLILGGTAPSRDEHGKAIAHTWPGAVRTRDFGGEYAGKLTRDAAAGDTPPMVMWRAETPEHGALLAEVRDALGSRMSKAAGGIVVTGAPSGVTWTAMRGRNRRGVHLVNRSEGEVGGMRVRLPCGSRDQVSVYRDGSAVEARLSRVAGGAEIELPTFRTACIATCGLRAGR